jgi:hypothetical protein
LSIVSQPALASLLEARPRRGSFWRISILLFLAAASVALLLAGAVVFSHLTNWEPLSAMRAVTDTSIIPCFLGYFTFMAISHICTIILFGSGELRLPLITAISETVLTIMATPFLKSYEYCLVAICIIAGFGCLANVTFVVTAFRGRNLHAR